MDHLESIPEEELRDLLSAVEGKKPTLRIVAAIAYKNGITQTELAEWLGVERKTIYNWLSRLDEGAMCRAVTDEKRPGRPRKLSPEERTRLEATLQEPPAEAGYDEPAWTPELVRRHVREAFGVEYSLPSCRRLLSEAGLRYRPRIRNADGRRGGWAPE